MRCSRRTLAVLALVACLAIGGVGAKVRPRFRSAPRPRAEAGGRMGSAEAWGWRVSAPLSPYPRWSRAGLRLWDSRGCAFSIVASAGPMDLCSERARVPSRMGSRLDRVFRGMWMHWLCASLLRASPGDFLLSPSRPDAAPDGSRKPSPVASLPPPPLPLSFPPPPPPRVTRFASRGRDEATEFAMSP